MRSSMNCPGSTLFGLGIRGGGGDGRRHRGLLRGGGRAMGAFVGVAAANGEQGGGGNIGQDDGFHIFIGCLVNWLTGE